MFPIVKSLFALHAIFLLMVSASPVDIATGIEGMRHDFLLATSLTFYIARGKENTPAKVDPDRQRECRTNQSNNYTLDQIWEVWRDEHGKQQGNAIEDCVGHTPKYVLDPACFSSANILHMLPRCKIVRGKAICAAA
jgi:hypothetical protein